MKNKLFIDSKAFMTDVRERAILAKESLYVQGMTFEGDEAGQQLISIFLESSATDKRLLIDSYSKAVINDHFIFSPKHLLDKAFRSEIIATKKLIKTAISAGIKVKYTNPLGWFGFRYPLRNHKKMIVIDETTSYLGGINFSDHNFEWHDMMIRSDDPGSASLIALDFKSTWEGENQSKSVSLEGSELYFLNGIKSKNLYDELFDTIRSASKSIKVISPYLSEPWLSVLKEAATEGLEVSIISPEGNNKSVFSKLVLSELKKGYFRLYQYPDMTHLKAILIDNEKLIYGSCNYDMVSYHFEQEVIAVSSDPHLIEEFRKQVLDPAMDIAKAVDSTNSAKTPFSLRLLKIFCQMTSGSILVPK